MGLSIRYLGVGLYQSSILDLLRETKHPYIKPHGIYLVIERRTMISSGLKGSKNGGVISTGTWEETKQDCRVNFSKERAGYNIPFIIYSAAVD